MWQTRLSAAVALAAALLAPSATVVAADLARQDYMLNCQGCHLANGAGSPGKVPRLSGFLGNFLHVTGGREYIVQVPGVAHSVLDDTRLAAVINWVLENFSRAQLPPDFAPYTAEEVGRLRTGSLLDVNARRAELLRAIADALGVQEAPGAG